MAEYYVHCGSSDYYNDKKVGKFSLFCKENGFDDSGVIAKLNQDPEDFCLVDFDKDFPIRDEVQNRSKHILYLLMQVYQNGTCIDDKKVLEHSIINMNTFKVLDSYNNVTLDDQEITNPIHNDKEMLEKGKLSKEEMMVFAYIYQKKDLRFCNDIKGIAAIILLYLMMPACDTNAIAAYKSCMEVYEMLYEDINHLDIMRVFIDIADIYYIQKLSIYDSEALENYKKALNIHIKVYGKRNLNNSMSVVLNKIIEIYKKQENKEEEEKYLSLKSIMMDM